MTTPTPTTRKRSASNVMSDPKYKKRKDDEGSDIAKGLDAKQADMYITNAKASPLLRLPAEIRNLVHEYAIGGNRIIPNYIDCTREVFLWCRPLHTGGRTTTTWKQLFTLSLVSRQLHTETKLLPYELNVFEVGEINNFQYFLDQMPDEKGELIKTVLFGNKTSPSQSPSNIVPLNFGKCTNVTRIIRKSKLHPRRIAAIEKLAEQKGLQVEVEYDRDRWHCFQNL